MFNRWFQGRYGVDQLSRALIIASLIVSVISWFFGRAPAGVYYALARHNAGAYRLCAFPYA